MKKVITLILYNRPDYTRSVLDALRRCAGVGEYLILPHIEPGNEEVVALARQIDFAPVIVTVNPHRLGIGRNTFLAWEHGFSKADFIVHIEDDTVPAHDCLRFMEYCGRTYASDDSVFSVAAYNRVPCPPSEYYQISRRPPYTCWLVGTWKNRWEWIKDRWSSDPDRYARWMTATLSQYELSEVYPALSRSQNIGAERGVHVPSPEWHRRNQHTEHWAGKFDLVPGPYQESTPLVEGIKG